jgi:hypothetical protein
LLLCAVLYENSTMRQEKLCKNFPEKQQAVCIIPAHRGRGNERFRAYTGNEKKEYQLKGSSQILG